MPRTRRIRRWLWNGAVVVSVVMMVGVSAVIGASYWREYCAIRMVGWWEYDSLPEFGTVREWETQDRWEIAIVTGDIHVYREWESTSDAVAHSYEITWERFVYQLVDGSSMFNSSYHRAGHEYEVDLSLVGIELYPSVVPQSDFGFWFLGFPLSYPLAAAALLPTLWLIHRYRNRHKNLPGHCSTCGYNLTGTIAAGRSECPECGAPAC